MLNRSDIDLAGISTGGENLGTGIGVFKEKNMSGNTLQFKTLCATGGLSIVTGDTELTIVGTTGITVSGASNYVLKINGTGDNVEVSSIYDSGTTATDNLHIYRYNLVLGGDTVDSCKITIKPLIDRKIELIASSGVNIGDLDACICIGHGHAGFTGLTLLAAGHYDLLLHAGSCTAANCSGKNLLLSGGDGNGTGVGGNVVLTGGTGSVSGNIILSTPTGKIKMCNLPAKTTETCGLYIDSNGNLSKGLMATGTGNTTIAGGTLNHIPVFNSAGNNIQNSTLTFSSDVLCNNSNLTIETADACRLYLYSPTVASNVNIITLGKPTAGALISCAMICPAGLATNINLQVFTKGTGYMYLSSPTLYLGGVGCTGIQYTNTNNTLSLPSNVKVCGYGGTSSSTDGKAVCIIGGSPYTTGGNSGHGGSINILGGNAAGVITKTGGTVTIKAGTGIVGGSNGRIQLCNLPSKSSETCGLYIDASGNLSTGVISGGSGGGGAVGVTGATNGVCRYNTNNVCLGGTLTGTVLLCAPTLSDSLQLCSTCGSFNNKTTIGNGILTSTSCDTSKSGTWCGVIVNNGCVALCSSNIAATCNNQILIQPDVVSLIINGASNGFLYNADYCTKFNANPRSIVDVGWVKRYALGGWSNLTKGTTVAGCGTVVSGGTICQNTFYGVDAGGSITSGQDNVGVGFRALDGVTTGNANIAIGSCALYANVGGNDNTAIGFGSLRMNTTGLRNTGIGCFSLAANTTGNDNTAIGRSTLANNTVGNNNIAIGYQSLAANIACDNVGLGYLTLVSNSSGCANFASGWEAMRYNTTGCHNIAIGACALNKNTTASYNIALGFYALCTNTTGEANIAIGINTLRANSTGTHNIAFGNGTLLNNTTGGFNVGIGENVLMGSTTGSQNIAIGYAAMQTGTNTGTENIAIGGAALKSNTSGLDNVAIGSRTLCVNTTGACNVAIGSCALTKSTTGLANVAVGYYAMCSNTTGNYNVGIGEFALMSNVSSTANVAVGDGALRYNTGGNNTGLGYGALRQNTSGSENVGIGMQAAYSLTTGMGNVAIGVNALGLNTVGTGNVVVGCSAGYNNYGSGNVFIGNAAGNAETGSNKLYIANTSTATPLIYGEFPNTCVKINGVLCATGNMCAPDFILTSDKRLKTNIQSISIAPVDIEYKQFELISEPNQLRYGVIAQDLEKVNPELVKVNCEGILGVSYTDLLIKEVAYLKCEVKLLKNEIEVIKSKL